MGRGVRRAEVAIAIALAVATGAGGGAGDAQQPAAAPDAPAVFADIPGVTIAYYDVAGTDQNAIRAAMLKLRPTDPADGRRVDALTRTHLRWSWPARGGGCRLDKASVTFSATVRMPRLADPAVPAAVRADWARYMARLEAHELTHLRYGYEGRLEVLAAIKAATCATANAASKAALRKIQQRDAAFDRATDHGKVDAAF